MGRKKLEIATLTDFKPKALEVAHSTSIGRAIKSGTLNTRQYNACIAEMYNRLLPIVTFFGKQLFHGDETKAREMFDKAFFEDCINKINTHWKDNGSFEAWCTKNIKNMMLGELRVKIFKNHRWQVSLSGTDDNEDNGTLDRTQAQILSLRDEKPLMDDEDPNEKKVRILQMGIERLSPNEKTILELRFYKNLKPEDIQDEMDLSRKEYTKLFSNAKENLEREMTRLMSVDDKTSLFKKYNKKEEKLKKLKVKELEDIEDVEDEDIEYDEDLQEFDNIIPDVNIEHYY